MKTLKNVETMYKEYEDGSLVVLPNDIDLDSIKSLILDAMEDVVKSVTPASQSKMVTNKEKYGYGVGEERKDGYSRQLVPPEHQGGKSDLNTRAEIEGVWDKQRQKLAERRERGETPENGWKTKKSISSEDAIGIIETVLVLKGYVANLKDKRFGSALSKKQTESLSEEEEASVGAHSRVRTTAGDRSYPSKTYVPEKDAAAGFKPIKPNEFNPKKHGSPSTHVSEPFSPTGPKTSLDKKVEQNIKDTGQKDPTNPQNKTVTVKAYNPSDAKTDELDMKADREEELAKLQDNKPSHKGSAPKKEKDQSEMPF